MGNLGSSRAQGSPDEDAEEDDSTSYHFPPKKGSYFGSHFMLGCERFELLQPEALLFSDSDDINYFGNKPAQFSCSTQLSSEPLHLLHCLVNVRRDSIKFIKKLPLSIPENDVELSAANLNQTPSDPSPSTSSPPDSPTTKEDVPGTVPSSTPLHYAVGLVLDCDVPCSVTIYFFAKEEILTHGLSYVSKYPRSACSKTYHFPAGANQVLTSVETVCPSLFKEDELTYSHDVQTVPVVIHCIAAAHSSTPGYQQAQVTLASMELGTEGNEYVLKPIKQKLFVGNGLCFLLHEIYGVENKCHYAGTNIAQPVEPVTQSCHADVSPLTILQTAPQENMPTTDGENNNNTVIISENTNEAEEFGDCDSKSLAGTSDVIVNSHSVAIPMEDSNAECVICMSELRDTVILPCRHLCVCYACAETLRYKLSNCPICRSPFRALLQLKVFRRIPRHPLAQLSLPNLQEHARQHEHEPIFLEQSSRDQEGFLSTRYEVVPLIDALNGPSGFQRMGTLPKAIVPISHSTPRPPKVHSSTDAANRSRRHKKKRHVTPIQQVLVPPPIASGEDDDLNLDLEHTMVNPCATSQNELTDSHSIRSAQSVTGSFSAKRPFKGSVHDGETSSGVGSSSAKVEFVPLEPLKLERRQRDQIQPIISEEAEGGIINPSKSPPLSDSEEQKSAILSRKSKWKGVDSQDFLADHRRSWSADHPQNCEQKQDQRTETPLSTASTTSVGSTRPLLGPRSKNGSRHRDKSPPSPLPGSGTNEVAAPPLESHSINL